MATATKSIQEIVDETVALNSAYAMEDESGARFPWLQADEYKPRNLKETVNLCIPEAALELLADDAMDGIESQPITTIFGEDEGLAYVFKNVRWIILTKPTTAFAQNKDDGSIKKIFKGMKFGDEWKSVSRLYLACIVGDSIMVDDQGTPQIWQMKLSGLKTQWIDGKIEDKTIAELNKSLCKHYKVKKGWITHLVSVAISAFPRNFSSAIKSKESSIGTMFGFAAEDKAKPLSEANQKLVFELVSSDDFKAMAKDPFGIESLPESFSPPESTGNLDEPDDEELDGISY